jgi:hypothetical protein
MSSKRVYGSIALQAFIGLFYALVMVGRVDNFLETVEQLSCIGYLVPTEAIGG